MNPYAKYYEAIQERDARFNRFNNADPTDHRIVDATIYELKASDLRMMSECEQLGNVRLLTKRETIMDKVRRALSYGK